ncbi:MAG: hypothetical protein U9P70_02540 [Patescibacteria group bacterium]|nr:hypothetical protein [Patescibacteria group bacterium]
MIRINLLSPVDKLNIKWEKTNRLATHNYAIIIVIQVFFVFILLSAVGYLSVEEKKLNMQLDNMQSGSEVKEINIIKKEVIKYNNQLGDISEAQGKQFYWVEILDSFSKIVPYGISINSVSIDPKSNNVAAKYKKEKTSPQNNTEDFKVIITGVSKTMEDLLIFENGLRNSEILVDFNIDPKNYDDENFSYVLSIKKESVLSN